MLIKQLSIFLENKKGRFTEVAKILGEAGVNMSAFTVAENSDFGILRLIVSDTDTAMYAFSQGEAANVIIRPDNVEKCAEVLKANKLELIAASDLYKL